MFFHISTYHKTNGYYEKTITVTDNYGDDENDDDDDDDEDDNGDERWR